MKNKKQTSIFLALLTLALLAFSQPIFAAEAPAFGVVDFNALIQQHPDMVQSKETLNAFVKQSQAEYDTESANLSDADKKALLQQLQQGVNQKDQELVKAIGMKVEAAIKEVAADKGPKSVVEKRGVIFGNGQDITDDVLKKITGK